MTAAPNLLTMNAIMRNVKFRLLAQNGYRPGMSEEESREADELTKELSGYFHGYTQDVDTSKDTPYVKTLALIEDSADGHMYAVDPLLMSFVEPYEPEK